MKLVLEMPETAFSSLRKSPVEFAQELKLAACDKWYKLGKLYQAKAAETAVLSRAAFIDALHMHRDKRKAGRCETRCRCEIHGITDSYATP